VPFLKTGLLPVDSAECLWVVPLCINVESHYFPVCINVDSQYFPIYINVDSQYFPISINVDAQYFPVFINDSHHVPVDGLMMHSSINVEKFSFFSKGHFTFQLRKPLVFLSSVHFSPLEASFNMSQAFLHTSKQNFIHTICN